MFNPRKGISLSEDINVEISLAVSDAELTTIENFNLTIQSVNDSPQAYDQDLFMDEDAVLTIELYAIDSDDYELNYFITESVLSGTLDDSNISSGIIEYTPNLDYAGNIDTIDDSLHYIAFITSCILEFFI